MPAAHSKVHKMPFVRVLLPLAGGILLYDCFPVVWWIFAPLAAALLFFALTWLRDFEARFYSKPFFGLGLLCFFFGIGAFTTHVKTDNIRLDMAGQVTLTGRVGESPQSKNGYYSFVFRVDTLKTAYRICSKPVEVMAYLRTVDSLPKTFCAGQGLQLFGRYVSSDSVAVRDSFDYGLFLKRKGVSGIYFTYPRNVVLRNDLSSPHSFYALIDRWRTFLLERYKPLHLSNENYTVLSALTLGAQSLLPDLQKAYYAQSGLAHVLAVSGMHVAILYAVLCLLFGVRGLDEKRRLFSRIAIIVFLWFFAFLSGFSPPAVRATFMFSLFLLGELLGRRVNSYNILFAVATFMFLLNPFYLFDVSFLLSFGALAAILYFDPLLKRLLSAKNAIVLYFRDIVTISTAAQLGTIPLLLRYFGSFSLLFPLANLLVLPLLPLLLFLGWIYLPLSGFAVFDPFFHDALTLLLNYMNGVAGFIASVPCSHLDTGIIPLRAMVALYVALAVLIYLLQRIRLKRKKVS